MVRPSYPYPFEEFVQHYDGVRATQSSDSFEGNLIRVLEYMHGVCADDDEARWKAGRFVRIMAYVAEHIQDFDKGDFAVVGSPAVGALVGQHIFRAAHQIFTTEDLSSLGHGPSPESVLELAAQFRPTETGGEGEKYPAHREGTT